ncbi:Fic/DOC family protein [Legionella santicrucis]|uniref:Fic/DOC family protein n=1 Tax=Legionella santicrucis TaxID=45074 RepID=A0A0W0YA15_9GAMM|nr:ankyrin repeat domain-containing protein [Legionella santicrucis]KTD53749.1 Fic/DOC family protein [Legionella santicrucis]
MIFALLFIDFTMDKIANPIKNPLSAANTWRMLIDGHLQTDKHEYGFWNYENREPGSVKGLLFAWQHVNNTLGTPLNLNFFRTLHKLCMDNTQFDDVQITRWDYQVPGEVRKINLDTCGINAKYLNEKRIARIQALGKKLKCKPIQKEGNVVSLPASNVNGLEDRMEQLIAEFNSRLSEEVDKEKKLKLIADFMQRLEMMHFFRDGNLRIHMMILNKLLIENELPPCIIDDPFKINYLTLEELTEEIKKWQTLYRVTQETGTYPQGMTLIQIIKEKPYTLHWLATCGDVTMFAEVLALYKKASLDIDTPDAQGNTPLIIASYFGYIDIVKLLIENQADSSYQGELGLSAYDWAQITNNQFILDIMPQPDTPIKNDSLPSGLIPSFFIPKTQHQIAVRFINSRLKEMSSTNNMVPINDLFKCWTKLFEIPKEYVTYNKERIRDKILLKIKECIDNPLEYYRCVKQSSKFSNFQTLPNDLISEREYLKLSLYSEDLENGTINCDIMIATARQLYSIESHEDKSILKILSQEHPLLFALSIITYCGGIFPKPATDCFDVEDFKNALILLCDNQYKDLFTLSHLIKFCKILQKNKLEQHLNEDIRVQEKIIETLISSYYVSQFSRLEDLVVLKAVFPICANKLLIEITNNPSCNKLFTTTYNIQTLAEIFNTAEQKEVIFNKLIKNKSILDKLFSDNSYFEEITKIFSPLVDVERILKRHRESELKVSSSILGFFNQDDLERNGKRQKFSFVSSCSPI